MDAHAHEEAERLRDEQLRQKREEREGAARARADARAQRRLEREAAGLQADARLPRCGRCGGPIERGRKQLCKACRAWKPEPKPKASQAPHVDPMPVDAGIGASTVETSPETGPSETAAPYAGGTTKGEVSTGGHGPVETAPVPLAVEDFADPAAGWPSIDAILAAADELPPAYRRGWGPSVVEAVAVGLAGGGPVNLIRKRGSRRVGSRRDTAARAAALHILRDVCLLPYADAAPLVGLTVESAQQNMHRHHRRHELDARIEVPLEVAVCRDWFDVLAGAMIDAYEAPPKPPDRARPARRRYVIPEEVRLAVRGYRQATRKGLEPTEEQREALRVYERLRWAQLPKVVRGRESNRANRSRDARRGRPAAMTRRWIDVELVGGGSVHLMVDAPDLTDDDKVFVDGLLAMVAAYQA